MEREGKAKAKPMQGQGREGVAAHGERWKRGRFAPARWHGINGA